MSKDELFYELNQLSMKASALNSHLISLLKRVDPQAFKKLGLDK